MLKSWGWGGGVVVVVVGWYKILVSAPVPLELILLGGHQMECGCGDTHKYKIDDIKNSRIDTYSCLKMDVHPCHVQALFVVL